MAEFSRGLGKLSTPADRYSKGSNYLCLGPFALLPRSRLHRKSLTARVGFDLGEIQLLPAIRQSCSVAYCVGNVTSDGEPQPWPQANNKISIYFIARLFLVELCWQGFAHLVIAQLIGNPRHPALRSIARRLSS